MTEKQERTMDFIVDGCPRSGTSAISRYLNCSDVILCVNELFRTGLDHSKLKVPDAFMQVLKPRSDWRYPMEHSPHRIEEAKKYIQAKAGQIRYYGSKYPTYFYRIPEILDELAPARSIVALRALDDIAMSYEARSLAPRDPWRNGRTSIFALADFMILCLALNRLDDDRVLLVPNRALLKNTLPVVEEMCSFVAAGKSVSVNEASVVETLEKGYFRKRRAEIPAPSAPLFSKFNKALASSGLGEAIESARTLRISEIRGPLSAFLAHVPEDPIYYLARILQMRDNKEELEYFPIWRRTAHVARVTFGFPANATESSAAMSPNPTPLWSKQ